MIVPFIFTLSTYLKDTNLWVFYHYLTMCKKYGWPIIAHENYFSDVQLMRESNPALFNPDHVNTYFMYDIPTNADIESIRAYKISESFTRKLLAEHRNSYNGAYCSLLSERNEDLEVLVNKYIDEIENEYDKKIDAMISINWYPSLSYILKKRGISFLHFEMGCFRQPHYHQTAMLKFSSLYGSTDELEFRYEEFLKEISASDQVLLTHEEILALFLRQNSIHCLNNINDKPHYRLGVATGWVNTPITLIQDYLVDEDLLYQANLSHKAAEDLLVRLHPNDLAGAQYPYYARNKDCSSSPIEFILKCSAIASVSSNVSIEACFWRRRAYTFAHCPSYYMTSHDLSDETSNEPPIEYLNFYAFCFLLPWEYINDAEYLSWRLSNPSELEIYCKHLDYILAANGLDKSIFNLDREKRLGAIRESKKETEAPMAAPVSGVADHDRETNRYPQLDSLSAEEIRRRAVEYEKLLNTVSWKITRPIRAIRGFFGNVS